MSEHPVMRRAPAAAAPIPVTTMTAPATAAISMGHPAAQRPPATPTRAHQSGGQPTSRPAHHRTLNHSPPLTTGRWGDVAAATPASRSYVLASLRALHLDPEAPTPAQQQPSPEPVGPARPKNQPHAHQPTRLTNRSTSVVTDRTRGHGSITQAHDPAGEDELEQCPARHPETPADADHRHSRRPPVARYSLANW
jgi:hypothetical protein